MEITRNVSLTGEPMLSNKHCFLFRFGCLFSVGEGNVVKNSHTHTALVCTVSINDDTCSLTHSLQLHHYSMQSVCLDTFHTALIADQYIISMLSASALCTIEKAINFWVLFRKKSETNWQRWRKSMSFAFDGIFELVILASVNGHAN